MSNVNYSSTKLLPALHNYGCRNRLPHDFIPVYETPRIKVERCKICNKMARWKKHYKGRTDNRAYLIEHARSFAQPNGRTKRLYYKINKPTETIIHI